MLSNSFVTLFLGAQEYFEAKEGKDKNMKLY